MKKLIFLVLLALTSCGNGGEVFDEIYEEVFEEVSAEVSAEIFEEVFEEVYEEIPEEIFEEIPEEIPEEIYEEFFEEAPEETLYEPQPPQEIPQEQALPDMLAILYIPDGGAGAFDVCAEFYFAMRDAPTLALALNVIHIADGNRAETLISTELDLGAMGRMLGASDFMAAAYTLREGGEIAETRLYLGGVELSETTIALLGLAELREFAALDIQAVFSEIFEGLPAPYYAIEEGAVLILPAFLAGMLGIAELPVSELQMEFFPHSAQIEIYSRDEYDEIFAKTAVRLTFNAIGDAVQLKGQSE